MTTVASLPLVSATSMRLGSDEARVFNTHFGDLHVRNNDRCFASLEAVNGLDRNAREIDVDCFLEVENQGLEGPGVRQELGAVLSHKGDLRGFTDVFAQHDCNDM